MKYDAKVGVSLLLVTSLVGPVLAFDFGGELDSGVQKLEQQVQPNSPPTGNPAALNGVSKTEQVGGLKQALSQGANTAVDSLSQVNGYLNNPAVRIPLPNSLQRLDDTLRPLGLGRYGDELTVAMNHAAEEAVPLAKSMLLNAISQMSVADVTGILTGGANSATAYFRSKTEAPLARQFRPVIKQSTARVALAQKYNEIAAQGQRIGLVPAQDANINDYVTQKALDGLYTMMGQEEQAIRANPLQATGDLAKKVFSALRP
ncbi:MAG: DUF4197 domain-containing protein [Ferrovum sp.]|nr:DUF4197 domain-containing protein [Ferrovum sp.]